MKKLPMFFRRHTLFVFFALFLANISYQSAQAEAMEFVITGPRAVGMGGAGVATTTDSLATYWNPAGLAMKKKADFRMPIAIQVIDRVGVLDTLDEIDAIDTSNISITNQDQLQGLFNRLNGGSVSALATGGLYVKGYTGNHAFGLSISAVGTAGTFVPTPLTATVRGTELSVTGTLQGRALGIGQIAASYAYELEDGKGAIGVTGKIMKGSAYANNIEVFSANDGFDIRGDMGKPKVSTQVGVDIGAIVRPSSWLRIGVIGKNLNQPEFEAPNGETFQLGPQIRGGLAVKPYPSLTLAFDGDVTSNTTLVPGIKSRVLSLGAEQTIFGQALALRVGALKNVKDAKSKVTPTAGLGVKILAFQLDLAVGYDFKQRGVLGAASVALTF